MKTIYPAWTDTLYATAILLILAFVHPIFAQQSYTYLFSAAPFTSIPAGGPVLEPIGTTFTPVSVILPASTCPDMNEIDLTHFQLHSGFKAKAFFTATYSIEMIFKFNELISYNRIIDFSNSISDSGIYTHNDCLNFFPTGNIGMCPGAFDTINYKQIVITRNNESKEMKVYVNGTIFTTHIDNADYYVIRAAPNDSIKFFKDDHAFENEDAPGNVALIRMCDFVLSPDEVISSYTSFCNRLTAVHQIHGTPDICVYPNPVKDHLTIQLSSTDFTKSVELTILNAIGQKLFQTPVYSEWTNIDLSNALPGLYFYQLYVRETLIKTGKIIHE